MPEKLKKLKVKTHTIRKDDLMKVAGVMYQVTELTATSLGSARLAVNLRPVNVDTYHEDARLYIQPLAKTTIYRPIK